MHTISQSEDVARRSLGTHVFAFVYLLLLQGCMIYTTQPGIPEELEIVPGGVISEALLATGETVVFDEDGAEYDAEKKIIRGYTAAGNPLTLKRGDVLRVQVKKPDPSGTILVRLALYTGIAVASTMAAFVIVFMLK